MASERQQVAHLRPQGCNQYQCRVRQTVCSVLQTAPQVLRLLIQTSNHGTGIEDAHSISGPVTKVGLRHLD